MTVLDAAITNVIDVVALAAFENIGGIGAAIQGVVAVAAIELVAARFTIETIIAFFTDQRVVSAPP